MLRGEVGPCKLAELDVPFGFLDTKYYFSSLHTLNHQTASPQWIFNLNIIDEDDDTQKAHIQTHRKLFFLLLHRLNSSENEKLVWKAQERSNVTKVEIKKILQDWWIKWNGNNAFVKTIFHFSWVLDQI